MSIISPILNVKYFQHRRKIEADLKVTQEVVIDLERDKKDFETMIDKKDKDIHNAMRRLEDEQVIVAKLQKAIKELQGRIESQEEELEAERQVRVLQCSLVVELRVR